MRLDRIFALAVVVVLAPAIAVASAAAAAAVVACGARFDRFAQAFERARRKLLADQLFDRLDIFAVARRVTSM